MSLNIRRLLIGLLIVALGASATVHAAEQIRFDLPPQALLDSLRAVGERTGTNVLASSASITGLKAPALQGQMTADEAFRRLLAGTGLRHEFLDEKTVTFVAIVATSSIASEATDQNAPNSDNATAFRLAQNQLPSSTQEAQRVSERSAAEEDARSRGEGSATEVVVTGSRMKLVGEGPKPVYTFTREQIDRSGQSTVATFLSTLPQVSTATGENSAQLGSGQTTVQLRGLPPGSTLVLLNGRRVHNVSASYGSGGLFDLNMIPAAAVERIEILPDSASAVYGSDALAGVVNVILKKDFEGAEAGARYGFADSLAEQTANIAVGRAWERGAFSVVGTYFGRPDRLQGTERAITADKDLRPYGGPDSRRTVCNPGNITSTNGANLPGLSASMVAIPDGLQGVPTIAQLAPGAGLTHRCSDLAKYVVVQETERLGAVASGHFELTPSSDVFAELIYSSTHQHSANNNLSLSNLLVPASNAFNPFGVNLRVNYLFDDNAFQHVNEMHATFARALVGLRGTLFSSWDWEITGSRSRDHNGNHIGNGITNTANINAALAASDPATAFNVFTSGAPAPRAVLDTFYSPGRSNFDSKLDSVAAFVRGNPFSLPAGPVQLVVGADFGREDLMTRHGTVVVDADRDATSFFTEIRLPLLNTAASRAFGDTLAVTAALRRDDYSDFGSQTSPQVGIEWRPAGNLLVRASYGEAFRAPGLYVLYGQTGLPFNSSIVDPRRGSESRIVSVQSGPNPNLKSELGESRSLGFVWHSESLPSLTAGLTAWQVEQTDRVRLLLPQDIVNNEAAFPDRIQRQPAVGGVPGPIVSVDRRYLNFGNIDVAGVDAVIDYTWKTSTGNWSPRLAVTYTDKYDLQLTPSSPATDQVSRANTNSWAPRWKGTIQLGWSKGGYSASAAGRYVGEYLDYQDWGVNSHRLGNFWLLDMSARLDIGEAFGLSQGMLSRAHASIAVANALDSLPEWSWYSFSALGYDPTQYDIIGRLVQISVGVRW